MSVKAKIIGLVLLAFITAISFMTGIAVYNFDKAMMKINEEKLSAMVEDKTTAIENVLNNYESLLKSLATSQFIKSSLVEFDDTFHKIDKEVKVDKKSLKKELIAHYDNEYLDKVNYDIEGAVRRLTSQYLPSSLNGKIAQKIFILDNPNKIGEKNNLNFDPKYGFISYMQVHGKYHETFNRVLKEFGLYDIFLVDLKGDIVYTTYKEKDFATNLRTDVYKLSALGRAYFKSLKLKNGEMVFEDFAPYEPSYNAPAGFIASPIYIDDKLAGSLIFQLPIDKINKLVNANLHGETDEVYMVGQDFRLRTDLRFIDKIKNPVVRKMKTTIIFYEMENDFIKKALSGERGTGQYKNYMGKKSIISYAPLEIFGNRWAIVGEIATEEGKHDVHEIIRTIFSTSFVASVLTAILIFVFIDKLMATPLTNILETTENISTGDGDLTKRLDIVSKDEFGEMSKNINHFISRIQDLINDVKDLADQNIKVSNHVKHLSSSIAERIKLENKTVSQIAENGKQASIELKNTTSNIQETKDIIVDANGVLIEAKDEIQHLAKKVETTSSSQKELSSKLATLSDNAERIKDVLYVIDDIADQTNLLALNAAIEAARAGEFGKGFAVVAYEVTKLADKTQESLADVNKIVTIVLDEMKEAVSLMNQSAKSIIELAVVSSDTSRRITDTSNNIQDSVDIIEISVNNVTEVSKNIGHIIERIDDIVKLSNENNKNIDEMMKTSAELQESSQKLNQELQYYKS